VRAQRDLEGTFILLEHAMNPEELDACVRGMRNEMIDFTSELVGIASENPPGTAIRNVYGIESRLAAS
jgi:hypothetical protein